MATSETDTTSEPQKPAREKRGVPGGLWLSCADCGAMIFRKEAERLMNVCPECGYHMYLSARDRINWVLDEGTFESGLGFDGSSIRGWQGIQASDMLMIPDADTAVIDPFFEEPTVSVIADIEDPITRAKYSKDPRNVAKNAVE